MQKNESIHDRITQLVNKFGEGKNTVFASIIGSSEANVRGYRASVMPKYDFLEKIAINFDIDLNWLLTGRGSMLRAEKILTPKPLPSINQEYKGAPYYNVDFMGGFDLTFNDQTQNPDYYINYYPYNKEGVVWCNVTGHSMEPKINHGDVIALKDCTLNDVQYGEIYAVVLDTIRTVKILRKSQDPAKLRFVPINTNDFDEQEFEKKRIVKLYEVLGSISKFF